MVNFLTKNGGVVVLIEVHKTVSYHLMPVSGNPADAAMLVDCEC